MQKQVETNNLFFMVKFLTKMQRCDDAVALLDSFEFPSNVTLEDF